MRLFVFRHYLCSLSQNLQVNPVFIYRRIYYLFCRFIPGIPGEIAYHGFLFPWTMLLASVSALLLVGNLFIPIFYKMRLVSVYEVSG